MLLLGHASDHEIWEGRHGSKIAVDLNSVHHTKFKGRKSRLDEGTMYLNIYLTLGLSISCIYNHVTLSTESPYYYFPVAEQYGILSVFSLEY